MGDKAVGASSVYIRERDDFILQDPEIQGLFLMSPSPPLSFFSLSLSEMEKLCWFSCLFSLCIELECLAPKRSQKPKGNKFNLCIHQVCPWSIGRSTQNHGFMPVSEPSDPLLPVPQNSLRALTAFYPPYRFWAKLKLILSGLVRSCVKFPHPTIQALWCRVRRDSQSTTPPLWFGQG